MVSIRSGPFAIGTRLLHAALLILVAIHLGYSMGPSEYVIIEMAFRYVEPLQEVFAGFATTGDNTHSLYFGAWFLYLGSSSSRQ